MAARKPARASPKLRKAPLSPRYRRNYTTPGGTTAVSSSHHTSNHDDGASAQSRGFGFEFLNQHAHGFAKDRHLRPCNVNDVCRWFDAYRNFRYTAADVGF